MAARACDRRLCRPGSPAGRVAIIMFFPILWMVHDRLQDRDRRDLDAAPVLLLADVRELLGGQRACRLLPLRVEHHHRFRSGRRSCRLADRRSGGLCDRLLPAKRTKDLLLWMLSTKMMPAVGVLVPMYLLFRDSGLLDTRIGIIILFTLPTCRSSFGCSIPSSRRSRTRSSKPAAWTAPRSARRSASSSCRSPCRGSPRRRSCRSSCAGTRPSGASTSPRRRPAPLTAFIASFSSPEGLFWAKLSAASSLAVAPILVFGWLTQRQLVRGLTFGAVK